MLNKETPKEFALRVLRESRIDVDIEYCKLHNIKFEDSVDDESEEEVWARLANTEKNRQIIKYGGMFHLLEIKKK